MRHPRGPELITGRIRHDGTLINASSPFSINKISTGVYDIYFPSNVRLVSAVASTEATTYGATTIHQAFPINGFRIGINNTSTGAAADAAWSFVATVIPLP